MVLKDLIEEISLEELTSAINRIYDTKWHKIDVKHTCDYLYSGSIYFRDFSKSKMRKWKTYNVISITRNPKNKCQIGALYCCHRDPEELIYNRIKIDNDITIPKEEILAHIIFAYNLNNEELFDALSEIEEPYFSEKYIENKISHWSILNRLKKEIGEPDWILNRILNILKDDKISLGRKKQLYEFYHPIDVFLNEWEEVKTNTDLNISKKDFYNFYKTDIKEINYYSINSPNQSPTDYLINLIRNYEDRDFKSDYSDSIVIIWIGDKCNVSKTEIQLLIPIIKNMFPNPIIGIGNEKGKFLRIEVLLKK